MNEGADSPAAQFAQACRRGELVYQWDPVAARAVFYPRVAAPATGAATEWRVSAGLGTVYATTVAHRRGEPRANLALVDLDEGFRMMSRVEGVAPQHVTIGMRVRVRFDADATPVFVPA